MPDAPLPERPRLAGHVEARMHIVEGVAKVVLYDPRAGTVMEIAPDDWALLEQADGTRDLDALTLAATRVGRPYAEAEVRQLLRELAEACVLVDGLAPPPRMALVAARWMAVRATSRRGGRGAPARPDELVRGDDRARTVAACFASLSVAIWRGNARQPTPSPTQPARHWRCATPACGRRQKPRRRRNSLPPRQHARLGTRVAQDRIK